MDKRYITSKRTKLTKQQRNILLRKDRFSKISKHRKTEEESRRFQLGQLRVTNDCQYVWRAIYVSRL